MAKKAIEVHFEAPRQNAPAHLLANAELVFRTGLMRGLRLTGFALWKATGDEGPFVAVTLPARTTDKGFYDYLRTQTGEIKDLNRFKGRVVKEYRAWAGAPGGVPAELPDHGDDHEDDDEQDLVGAP